MPLKIKLPAEPAVHNVYQRIKNGLNYLNLPAKLSSPLDSAVVIIPVPFDLTSTWKKGADRGPQAILEASAHLEWYDIETDSEACRQGIFTHGDEIELTSSGKMVTGVEQTITEYLLQEKWPVILGGEHSVSLGPVRALAAKYQNLSVLQLDAHADLREEYEGSPLNHACIMARIKELCPVVQVGIRSMDLAEKKNLEPGRVFFARDIYPQCAWMESATALLTENVYITIDLDVFDPSVMPDTGTPEPGGLSWYDVLSFLKIVFSRRNVVGFDVVELCPDRNHGSEFLAAKLIYKMISYYFSCQGVNNG